MGYKELVQELENQERLMEIPIKYELDQKKQKIALRELKQFKKTSAEKRTEAALAELEALRTILTSTEVDPTIDFKSLLWKASFTARQPILPTARPNPTLQVIPPMPGRSDQKYTVRLTLLDHLAPSRQKRKQIEQDLLFNQDCRAWEKIRDAIEAHNTALSLKWKRQEEIAKNEYLEKLTNWEDKKKVFEGARKTKNSEVRNLQKEYNSGTLEGVTKYCQMVLKNSQYPAYLKPHTFNLDYTSSNQMLVVDYNLPSIHKLPTVKEVKYIQSNDKYEEKHLTALELNALYDAVLYQITLRTIYELFKADSANKITMIVFNGFVKSSDSATGKNRNSCILTIQVSKKEFLKISPKNVDPKACFKNFKGICCSKLHTITPVAPILHFDRKDKRFITSREVANHLDEGENIAAMDWEDFEHLVRELFEREFARDGAEVRVTRASRDGGIDAVVFDPDPIRGGKIVIQAKRYTNTVGVSAVRDLFGSVMNEGANKGILVSTADYGPDAYEFAKGKPILLLDGGNLLHLLEKHGTKARIDLIEAKQILAEKEKSKTK